MATEEETTSTYIGHEVEYTVLLDLNAAIILMNGCMQYPYSWDYIDVYSSVYITQHILCIQLLFASNHCVLIRGYPNN